MSREEVMRKQIRIQVLLSRFGDEELEEELDTAVVDLVRIGRGYGL